MGRVTKNRSLNNSLAIIADGKDERWYLDKVKEHYKCDRLKAIKINPTLPQKKKVKDLFELAKEKVAAEYSKVILLVDMDCIVSDPDEFERFKILYERYLMIVDDDVFNAFPDKQKKEEGWMRKVTVVVNNPCLEYWFLLHFKKTTKYYGRYEPELKADLRKCRGLEKYEKAEDYYKNTPDIYNRLEKYGSLEAARLNSLPFELGKAKERGCSEMGQLFDYFDNL